MTGVATGRAMRPPRPPRAARPAHPPPTLAEEEEEHAIHRADLVRGLLGAEGVGWVWALCCFAARVQTLGVVARYAGQVSLPRPSSFAPRSQSIVRGTRYLCPCLPRTRFTH